jgi:hypothetical protein
VATYVYANNRPTVMVDPSGMGAIWTNASGTQNLFGRVADGVAFPTLVRLYSVYETAAFTTAAGAVAIGGTLACAPYAGVACAGIAVTAGSAFVGGLFATYHEVDSLLESY